MTPLHILWHTQKQTQHRRIIWRAQSSDGIPSFSHSESVSSTARIAAIGDVMEYLRVGVQCRVDKSNSRLSGSNPLLIDAVQYRRKSRRCSRCATNKRGCALVEYENIVTNSRNVWVAPPIDVVEASIRTEAIVVGA